MPDEPKSYDFLTRTFWRHIQPEPMSGCWIWTAFRMPSGYGRYFSGSKLDGTRRTVYAHRFVYEQIRGAVPAGRELDHLCRQRYCVNPDHLQPVTRQEHNGRRVVRTHCYLAGHEFTEANTYHAPRGRFRFCRQCRRDKNAGRR